MLSISSIARPAEYVASQSPVFHPAQPLLREIAAAIGTSESHMEGFLSIQKRLVKMEIPALAGIDATHLDYQRPITAESYLIPGFVAKFWVYDRSPHTYFNILWYANVDC